MDWWPVQSALPFPATSLPWQDIWKMMNWCLHPLSNRSQWNTQTHFHAYSQWMTPPPPRHRIKSSYHTLEANDIHISISKIHISFPCPPVAGVSSKWRLLLFNLLIHLNRKLRTNGSVVYHQLITVNHNITTRPSKHLTFEGCWFLPSHIFNKPLQYVWNSKAGRSFVIHLEMKAMTAAESYTLMILATIVGCVLMAAQTGYWPKKSKPAGLYDS